jgi:dTDP-4-amino-4,6-dideoxy-D-galactose acyltransferase
MIEIAPYQSGDVRRMTEIAPDAFGVWARYGIDRTLPRDRVEQLYRDETCGYAERADAGDANLAILCARDGGHVVGYIVVGVEEGLSRALGMRWGRIISLAVDPPRHGERIGPKLVAAGMGWLREQKCEHVEVWTDLNNIAAIRTYEGAGFRVIYAGVTLSQRL